MYGVNPVEVDTALATAWEQKNKVFWAIQNLTEQNERMRKSKYSYYADSIVSNEKKIAELSPQFDKLINEIAELESKYEGWSRAFLVRNGNGHIHSTMDCGTCFPTTQFLWLTEYSGADEDKIVKDAGEMACSVCFPNAPVDYKYRPCVIADPELVEAKRIRDEAKRVRDEARELKGIKDIDGKSLSVFGFGKYRETLNTLRSAEIWLVNAGFEIATFDPERTWQAEAHEHKKVDFVRVLAAIAKKKNVSVDEVRAEAQIKIAKKVVKYEREVEKYKTSRGE
jgi:hypothetical protein